MCSLPANTLVLHAVIILALLAYHLIKLLPHLMGNVTLVTSLIALFVPTTLQLAPPANLAIISSTIVLYAVPCVPLLPVLHVITPNVSLAALDILSHKDLVSHAQLAVPLAPQPIQPIVALAFLGSSLTQEAARLAKVSAATASPLPAVTRPNKPGNL